MSILGVQYVAIARVDTHTSLVDKMKVQYLSCDHAGVNGDSDYQTAEILLQLWMGVGGAPFTEPLCSQICKLGN